MWKLNIITTALCLGCTATAATELGIKACLRAKRKDTQFTLNGKPTLLLGISYYGALGASKEAQNAR